MNTELRAHLESKDRGFFSPSIQSTKRLSKIMLPLTQSMSNQELISLLSDIYEGNYNAVISYIPTSRFISLISALNREKLNDFILKMNYSNINRIIGESNDREIDVLKSFQTKLNEKYNATLFFKLNDFSKRKLGLLE